MNQTAVEWLVEELTRLGHNFKLYSKEIEKAKEMEKQQIIDAYNSGQQKEAKQNFWTKGELYYNETFKQNNNGRSN